MAEAVARIEGFYADEPVEVEPRFTFLGGDAERRPVTSNVIGE